MTGNIQVGLDLSIGMSELDYVLKAMDEYERLSGEIKTLLSDTAKWEGKSHDRCCEIQPLIDKYEKELRTICESFKTQIQRLIDDADIFADNSVGVRRLRSW